MDVPNYNDTKLGHTRTHLKNVQRILLNLNCCAWEDEIIQVRYNGRYPEIIILLFDGEGKKEELGR